MSIHIYLLEIVILFVTHEKLLFDKIAKFGIYFYLI